MEATYSIRVAEQRDADDILRLMKEFAVYLRQPDWVKLTAKDFSEDLSTWYHCILLEHQSSDQGKPQEVVGCVIWYYTYNPWVGKMAFMEDLYISPGHRGQGNGSRLMQRVAKVSVGYVRFYCAGGRSALCKIGFSLLYTFEKEILFPDRGRGHASLETYVTMICRDKGCKGLKWEVNTWNYSAQTFYYNKMNALCMSERDQLSVLLLEGDDFIKLANGTIQDT